MGFPASQIECGPNKVKGPVFRGKTFQCGIKSSCSSNLVNEIQHRFRVGANFLHGTQIELKMTQVQAFPNFVRFFTQYDFINKSSKLWVLCWQPGYVYTGQLSLQGFQQGHEIQDSKNMGFHESLDGLQILQLFVNGMC